MIAFFGEVYQLGNPKIAILAYSLAVGFILAVAFHSPSKELTAASEPVLTPVVDLNDRPPGRAWAQGEGEVTRFMIDTRSNRWTSSEDDAFRKMAEANTRPELIAAELNRSVHAIKARAYAIGLPLKWFRLKAHGK
jgi:hypothetical protein